MIYAISTSTSTSTSTPSCSAPAVELRTTHTAPLELLAYIEQCIAPNSLPCRLGTLSVHPSPCTQLLLLLLLLLPRRLKLPSRELPSSSPRQTIGQTVLLLM